MRPTSNRVELTILWLIRELGPIDYHNLLEQAEQLRDDPSSRLPNGVRSVLDNSGHSLSQLRHALRYCIPNFVNMGIVSEDNTSEDSPFHNRLWSTTDKLSLIQHLFDIQLSTVLDSTQPFIPAYPIFGIPAEQNPNKYAEVFVAMPFDETVVPLSVYANHIKSVIDNLGLICMRGDDVFGVSSIIDDIWSAIYHAKLCIVDCTGRNPNVFYELGLAHTLGRKAILIAQSMDDVPFDVRHMRIIIYDISPEGLVEFEDKLRRTIVSELRLLDVDEK